MTARPARNGTVAAVVAACGDDRLGLRDAALVSVMAEGVMRGAEAARLQWRDIDDRTVRVPAVKGTHRRIVTISAAARARLDAWAAVCGASERVFGLSERSMGRVVARAGRRAGIEGLSGHSFRVGGMREMAAAGRSAPQLQAMAGHRRLETTAGYIGAAAAEGFADGPPAEISTDPAARPADSGPPQDALAEIGAEDVRAALPAAAVVVEVRVYGPNGTVNTTRIVA